VRNKVELAGPQPHPLQTVGRPSAVATRIGCMVNSRQHPPTTTKARMDCVVYHAHTKNIRQIQPKCEKCNTVLCISICFKGYHTKAQFQIVSHNNGLYKEIITCRQHLKVCNNFCIMKHFSDNTSCTLFFSCAMFHSCIEYLKGKNSWLLLTCSYIFREIHSDNNTVNYSLSKGKGLNSK
jgi:hypothetical protein